MIYTSLHHHSTYSYMDGLGTPDQHVARAAELGMSALALTEHGNTSSHVKLEIAAEKYGIKPLFGAELYTAAEKTRRKWHLTVLAENEVGYRNLNQLVSRSYAESFYQWPTVLGHQLAEHSEGLIVLSGCADSKLSCDLLGGKGRELHEDSPDYDLALDTVRKFRDLFGDRYYLECQQFPELARTRTLNPVFAKLSAATGVPLVATADCHYPHPDDNEMQVVLHAAGRGAGSAAEQAESWEYDIRLTHPTSDKEILRRLKGTGLTGREAQRAVAATAEIADRCTVKLPRAERLRFPVPAGMTTADYIWQKLREGWAYRYARNKRMQANKEEYGVRLKYEMEMILAKGFADYFLMLNDVVPYVKDHGCPVGPARGSAAASLACYLLRITEVDPLQFPTMVFERFIDITREDLPDVDLDFADNKRDMVRERLVSVWGADRVGNIGTFTKYKGKNSIDDIARVHHIPKSAAEAVKSVIVERSGGDARSDETLVDTLEMFPAAKAIVEEYPKLKLAMRLEGNTRGFGVHAAGLVVGDTKLTDVCAMYTRRDNITGQDRTVMAYDMKDAESLGMMKLDALGLSTMGMIDICLGLVGMTLEELYEIDMEDQPVLTAFRDGDVVGIFQFEGRATRLVTSQVRPTTFMELSDINALSRPGPLFSGATRKYIETKLGREKPELLHPVVDAITAQSQHQVIYQEQILKIVREIGDFSWTHAAAVRKIISKKKGEAAFNFNKQNFIDGAKRLHNMDEQLADRIWKTIVTSGTYAFCMTGETKVHRGSCNENESPEITLEELYRRINAALPVGAPRPDSCVVCDKVQEPWGRNKTYSRGMCRKCKGWWDQFQLRGLRIVSLDDDGRIRPNRLVKIHDPVERPILKVITESGRILRMSEEHNILTDTGYRLATELLVGDSLVGMGNREPNRSMAPRGFYKLLETSQTQVSARSGDECEWCGKPDDGKSHTLEFAHTVSLEALGGNWGKYHSPNNIVHLCNSCHKKYDHGLGIRKKKWTRGRPIELDKIISIQPDGMDLVYDVSMEGPAHNYIGNGVVSHNNVAHCISYSMLGFWAMWLKVNYPHEFYTAQLMKTAEAKWGPLLRDAAEHGVEVRPPDVRYSTADWTLTPERVIAAGFSQIKGVGLKTAAAIMDAREDAPFQGWHDLIRVPGIGPKTIVAMEQACNSDDFFGLKKVARTLHAVRTSPGAPQPTHDIDALIAQKQMGRDFSATTYFMVKQFNYQDAVEKERAKTGEEEAIIMKTLKDPHLRTMVSIYAYDGGDEPFSIRITRYAYPKWKKVIQSIRPNKDVVIVRGKVMANFGNMMFPTEIAVVDPEED